MTESSGKILSDDIVHSDDIVQSAGAEFVISAGNGRVIFRVAGSEFAVDPDVADQISADIRQFAIEARNGGRIG